MDYASKQRRQADGNFNRAESEAAMRISRTRMRFASLVVMLGISPVCRSQTVAVNPPSTTQLQSGSVPSQDVAPDAAKPLEGRLFFSPEERQRMDRARKRGLVPGEDGQIMEPPASVLNGFVKRSDGNTAVWVDGVPRWNANSKNADGLLPADVGGPASYLKASSGETLVPAPPPRGRAKKAARLSAKSITKPRLLR